MPDVFYLNKMSELFDFPLEELIGFEAIERTDVNVEKRTRAGKICLTLLLLLALAPLLVAVIARIFLPATIPAHYDSNGEITRWGSSKELVSIGGIYFLIVAGGGLAVYLALVRTHYPEVKAWTVWTAGAVFAAVAIALTAISVSIVRKDYAACVEAGYLPLNFGFLCAAIFVPVVVTLVAAFASVKLHKKIKADKKRERELFK